MRCEDLVLHFRQLLLDEGVALAPAHRDADGLYRGRGDPWPVWTAFKAMAMEPLDETGTFDKATGAVVDVGFGLDARAVRAGRKSGLREAHYGLSLSREFTVGEHGDTFGFFLVIDLPDDVEQLEYLVVSDQHRPFDPGPAATARWLESVEFLPVVRLGFERHALQFSFSAGAVG